MVSLSDAELARRVLLRYRAETAQEPWSFSPWCITWVVEDQLGRPWGTSVDSILKMLASVDTGIRSDFHSHVVRFSEMLAADCRLREESRKAQEKRDHNKALKQEVRYQQYLRLVQRLLARPVKVALSVIVNEVQAEGATYEEIFRLLQESGIPVQLVRVDGVSTLTVGSTEPFAPHLVCVYR